jgi:WD40 repeat protein
LCRWDLSGWLLSQFSVSGLSLKGLAVAPNDRTVAIPGVHPAFRQVLLCDLQAERVVGELGHSDAPERVAFSPDGSLLAVAAGRCVWLWDVAGRRPLEKFPAFARHAEALAFHPGGRLLAAGSRDGEVRLWDVTVPREMARFAWGIGAIHGLAFAPDGLTLAAAGHQHTVAVWDIE